MISDYEMYVYLSYLPDIAKANIQWLEYTEDKDVGATAKSESWWIQRGVKAFKDTIKQALATTPAGATHIVPLSAGLDSRAILGELVENLPGSQIRTITYGIPGAYDFEISKILAQKVGVHHETMNMLDEQWDLDHLIATGACLEHPASVFEAHVHRKICEHFGADCVFWSGFMAGSLAGVHLPPVPSANKEQAVKIFVRNNRTSNYKDQTFEEAMVRKILDEYPWEENEYQSKMGLDQQVDFGIRHRHYIRSVLLVKGFNYKAPFITKPWLSFILNVPYKLLLHEYMYKRVLMEGYPVLYQLPVRNNAGLPLSASHTRFLISKAIAKIKPHLFPKDPFKSHPRTNYTNFTESLRQKTRFQDLAYSTIQDLKKREIFPESDLDTWWKDHLSGKANNTVLLLNLSSLEILIKAARM